MARYEKVAEAIRQEVSSILHDEFKDPRIGFITVTRVELTSDLRFAKIFYSVLGTDQDYARTKQALDSGLGFIRKLVAERIPLRFAPEIMFKEDRSGEYSVRIQQVLDEIKELNKPQVSTEKKPKRAAKRGGRRGPKKGSRVHKKK